MENSREQRTIQRISFALLLHNTVDICSHWDSDSEVSYEKMLHQECDR